MSELIKCDACGKLIERDAKYYWNTIVIVEPQTWGTKETTRHVCYQCLPDIKVMLGVERKEE